MKIADTWYTIHYLSSCFSFSDVFQYNSFTCTKVLEVAIFLQVSIKALYVFLFSLRATCPTHLILVDLIARTIFGEQFKSQSPSLCSFHQTPATSSLLDLSILFSIALNLYSSLIVRDQVSHTYKTPGKIFVLYVLFSCSQICITQGGKRLWTQRRH
jgi:hypothetical protein